MGQLRGLPLTSVHVCCSKAQPPHVRAYVLQPPHIRTYVLQLTVQSWRLGWNFTDGETLSQAADYFPNTSYPLPGSFNASQVELQSTALQADNAQQGVLDAWFSPQQVCLVQPTAGMCV